MDASGNSRDLMQAKYREMFLRASYAIFVISTETGRILEANPQAATMTCLPVRKLAGMEVWDLHPEHEHAHARELWQRVRRDGAGFHDSLHFRRPDGAEVAVAISASVIQLGDIEVIQRVCRDITERKRRDKNLRYHRRLEDLLLTISADFIHTDPGTVDERLGEALARLGSFAEVARAYVYILTGPRRARLLVWGAPGVPYRDGVYEEVALDSFAWALDRLSADETVLWETRESVARLLAPGEEGPPDPRRSSVCVPMMVEDELLGFAGFDAYCPEDQWQEETVRLLRMIGYVFGGALARARAQLELRAAHDELEDKVQQRTKELRQKQAQLVQSEKMAALGQLVAGVAHEVNTPLGAIKSNADTMVRGLDRLAALSDDAALQKLVAAAREMNEVTRRAADQLDRIVVSLRNFARLDRAELEGFDLRQGLEDTLTLAAHGLRPHTVHRHFAEVPRVTCRADQINQVFMNLLVNAAQAMDRPGELHLRVEPADDGVAVEVQDTGQGIAPEHLPRLFDPGFTTKGVGVGTGLGLSISHQIVQEHGGRIDVQSDPGQGATFRVYLPLAPPG